MRLFNRQVFKDTAYNAEQYTDSGFNDMLGSAEALAIHAHSSRISVTTAKVRIRIYQSNDNKNWVLHSTLTGNALGTTSGTVDEFLSEAPMSTSALARGAFVRLGISMDGSSGDSADLIITVAGRTR